VQHTQQRPNRQVGSDLEPRVQLLLRPAIHPDLASLAALPAPDEHSTAAAVKIALLKAERHVGSDHLVGAVVQ
jgi:hypothetical protein